MRSITVPSSAGVEAGAGDNAPMPPVFGPGVAVAGALVVLRRGERQRVLAVDERKKARLFAGEKILDDDLAPGGAEPALDERRIDRPARGIEIFGDGHPLAGGEPVGLDDDRRSVARRYTLLPPPDRGSGR